MRHFVPYIDFLVSRLSIDHSGDRRKSSIRILAGWLSPCVRCARDNACQRVEHFISDRGNVVVLPANGESMWWYEAERFVQRFRGHHGGLEPDELHVPFAALTLGSTGHPA